MRTKLCSVLVGIGVLLRVGVLVSVGELVGISVLVNVATPDDDGNILVGIGVLVGVGEPLHPAGILMIPRLIKMMKSVIPRIVENTTRVRSRRMNSSLLEKQLNNSLWLSSII